MSKKLGKFFKAFFYAGRGILSGFKERNMRVHGLAMILVLSCGAWLKLNSSEWQTVLILIAIVMAAELSNTAIEELANLIRNELKLSYQATTRARDTAAGAVLVIAIVAAIIGLKIFLPKLILKLA